MRSLVSALLSATRGVVLLPVLVFGAVALIVVAGLVNWGASSLRLSRVAVDREKALHIAEAGIDYYRWHLIHNPLDYQDGTGGPGPYVHDVRDVGGVVVGRFSLDVTSPATGSSIVTIRSTGSVTSDPTVRRAIEVKLELPTLVQYAVVTNDALRIDAGTEVFGRVHSNDGVHFDGLAHGLVTSAKQEYKDPGHAGNDEFGVHTHVVPLDPPPPNPVPERRDVFEAGREFPVPAVDFAGISGDLADIKTRAQSGGAYLAASGVLGYHIVLKPDDTFDLSRVTRVVPIPNGCTEVLGQFGWGTLSIDAGGEEFIRNSPLPANGLIFAEDHVWVDGRIDSARLTIASGRFPDTQPTRTNIIVNKDLLYTNKDGRDVLALLAQGNISVGMVSDDDLEIDAALIAQHGRVGRHYYRPPGQNQTRCDPYHIRQSITIYGMIASNHRYGFSFTDGTGYQRRTITYDANLLITPPPNVPLTGSRYRLLSWEEVRPQ